MSRSFLVPILLPADPANPLEAATKQYVDAQAGGGSEVEISDTEPTDSAVELWYAPSGAAGMAEMQLWTWEGDSGTMLRAAGPMDSGTMATDGPPSTATELYISRLDSTGMIDWSQSVAVLAVGDPVYLQWSSDASSWHRYSVTGTPTQDGSGTWTIPVSTLGGSPPGTAPPVGEPVYVTFPTLPGGPEPITQDQADARYAQITAGPKLASGMVTVSYSALNTAASAAVTFPAGRFLSVPTVTATILSNAPLQFTPVTVLAKTTAGCTVYLAKIAGTASGTINVDWIAIL